MKSAHSTHSKTAASTDPQTALEAKTMSATNKSKSTTTESTNASATTSVPVAFLTPPPPGVHSPSPPGGFEVPAGANYRGVLPRGTELASVPAALQDLQKFVATYATTLGATAPPLDHFIAALTVASGWSNLRAESAAWDGYCMTEEGLAWQAARPMLGKLKTSFDLASDSNSSLTSEYPGLAALLGSTSTIAKKSVSTKRLNKQAVAEGKPPYHGLVGKRRQRKDEKAAAAQQAQPAAPVAPAAPPVASPTAAPQGGGH
jgi:hypothetical protein